MLEKINCVNIFVLFSDDLNFDGAMCNLHKLYGK